MEIFRSGEIEIKETLIAVALNNANCTVSTVQPGAANSSQARTKGLSLNFRAELEIEVVAVSVLVREKP
jgi:hypothetical protein